LVVGRVDDLAAGVELAVESVDSGRAGAALDALVTTSQAARSESKD
jgi:anthranilate phosphoribosyltransferase